MSRRSDAMAIELNEALTRADDAVERAGSWQYELEQVRVGLSKWSTELARISTTNRYEVNALGRLRISQVIAQMADTGEMLDDMGIAGTTNRCPQAR